MGLALAARLFWVTTAAICFMKQTLQRHIARLVLRPASCDRHHICSGCVRSLLVSSPRTCLTFEDMPSVALVELHVGGPLRRCRSCRAQPREVLMTTALFTHLQQTQHSVVRQGLYFGPIELSYQR
jgi:hypothetical protein